MRYKPLYRDGKCVFVHDAESGFNIPLAAAENLHRIEFQAWLAAQELTLEQWLASNPAPAAPAKTVSERRRDAYAAAWTNDEFQEAVFENLNGKPEKLTALNAKREEIRTRIK